MWLAFQPSLICTFLFLSDTITGRAALYLNICLIIRYTRILERILKDLQKCYFSYKIGAAFPMGSFYVCLVLYELRISQDLDIKSTDNNLNNEMNHHYILITDY